MDDTVNRLNVYPAPDRTEPKSTRATKSVAKIRIKNDSTTDFVAKSSRPVRKLIKSYLFNRQSAKEIFHADPLQTLDDLCKLGTVTHNKVCLIALKLSPKNEMEMDHVFLSRLHSLFIRADMKDELFRRLALRIMMRDVHYDIWVMVFQGLHRYLDGNDFLMILTQAIVLERFDIFKDIIQRPEMIIDMPIRVDLISRAYYAERHKFCAELIKDLSETDLTIIRSQIPDIDIVLKGDGGTMQMRETMISARNVIDLKTAYSIHKSLGSHDIDPDLAYEIFVNSLEFNDLNFARQVYNDNNKYIYDRLYELYVNLIMGIDQPRLNSLLKLDFEILRITTIFDFKDNSSLSTLQIRSLHKGVIDTAIDRGLIDRAWLLKFYRFYHRAIDRSCPEKLVILSEYINIPNETRILREQARIDRSKLSVEIYNGLVLYSILKSANPVTEDLVLYYINTRAIDVGIYDGLLLRTAVKMNRSNILHILT
jgi:hypothetical protein